MKPKISPSTPTYSEKEQVRQSVLKKQCRLRKNLAFRPLTQEALLCSQNLIQPVFVTEGPTHSIEHIPGMFRYQLADLLREVESIVESGVGAINLFCSSMPTEKHGSRVDPFQLSSLLARSLKALKSSFPELVIIADIAQDPSIFHESESGFHEAMCKALTQMALTACGAGADFISSSDMLDGRIGYLRTFLDEHDFVSTGIISHSVKNTSSLCLPVATENKQRQNCLIHTREWLYESRLDEQEGADMLLIKPAMFSLDIIAKVRADTLLPIGAFQSSGEWAMLQGASLKGWINRERVLLESLMAIRRAGADCIFCYGAKEVAQILKR